MQPTIAHLGIAVTDLDAAAAFYRDVLGVPSRGPEEADGARILHFEFGGTDVELLAPMGETWATVTLVGMPGNPALWAVEAAEAGDVPNWLVAVTVKV